MQNPTVTAIIVTYNSQSVITGCLDNLKQQAGITSIIVVDNSSNDDTCKMIQQKYPDVTLIENLSNEGFGKANNRALAEVQTDFALLINPDALLEIGTLDVLIKAAQLYSNAAILAPRLYDESGNLLKSYKQHVFDRENHRGKYYPPEGDLCADFLSGAVWLVNMKHLRSIGFFDKQIFLYYEDDDLCMRAKKAGYSLVLVHAAKAKHNMGSSSGEINKKAIAFRQEHMAWSRIYMEYKYHGKDAALKLAQKQRLEYAIKASLHMLLWQPAKISRYRARIKGIFAFTEALAAKKIA